MRVLAMLNRRSLSWAEASLVASRASVRGALSWETILLDERRR